MPAFTAETAFFATGVAHLMADGNSHHRDSLGRLVRRVEKGTHIIDKARENRVVPRKLFLKL